MFGLDQSATIYTTGGGGDFTVVAKAGLACRLALVSAGTATGGTERTELLQTRHLLWSEDYALPDDCQVEVDGQRWNPVPGTQAKVFMGVGAARALDHRRCDLVEAGS